MFKSLIQSLGARTDLCFRMTFADGSTWQNHDGEPIVRVHFKTWWAQWRLVAFGHVGFLEGYFNGEIDVDGDLGQVFRIGLQSRFDRKTNPLIRLRNKWHEWRFSNRSIAQAKANA